MSSYLVAPLREIVGLAENPYRGGFTLTLRCGHRVHGTPAESRQARVRCVKCRDEAERQARREARAARKRS